MNGGLGEKRSSVKESVETSCVVRSVHQVANKEGVNAERSQRASRAKEGREA